MLIDTHCHPLLSKEKSKENIIENFKKSGWKFLISIWTNLDSSKQSLILSRDYDFIFTTVWIHPTDAIKLTGKLDESLVYLEDLYINNKDKVVWIWECWLDYYRINKENPEYEKKIQKDFFLAQIFLAKKYNLPLIIHNREAWEDILAILKKVKYDNFIIHCFSEDLDFAKKCINIAPNCKLAFWWILTFTNAKKIQEAATHIPLSNIIIETDSPYLTPVPYRGKEENEPQYVKYVLDKLCELRKEDADLIKKQVFKNSCEIFKIENNI